MFPVKWENNYGGFSPFAVPGMHARRTLLPSEVEIVGNIYENPELISHFDDISEAA